MQSLRQVGATVYADGSVHGGVTFDLDTAALAHRHGIRYFGSCFIWKINDRAVEQGGRQAVGPDGNIQKGPSEGSLPWACPIQPDLYDRNIFRPVIEAAGTGLVDGLQMDWEGYAGQSEAMTCYCDVCFDAFLKEQKRNDNVPTNQRGNWLQAHALMDSYRTIHNRRRYEMWRDFAARVRVVKPDFMFSAYNVWKEAPESLLEALHNPDAPVIVLDHMFYYPDQSFNFWNARHRYFKSKGYLHVLGTYDNGLFGGRPQVTVPGYQWLYEAAIYADGNWVWFEQEITPALWQTWALANQRVTEVENAVGDFLFNGERDPSFVTAIESTGNPAFFTSVRIDTYHLNGEHLVHATNVETQNALTVKLLLTGMPQGSRWIVQDAITGVTLSPDEKTAEWTSRELQRGITVAMEKRTDRFLRLRQAAAGESPQHSSGFIAQQAMPFSPHPDKLPLAIALKKINGQPVYTVTRSMGFGGVQGKWAIANAIAGGDVATDIVASKGYLWSPDVARDGRHFAFTYDVNGRGQIYLAVNGESEAANFSRNEFCDRMPVFSPDGKTIAFLSDRDGNWDIYLMDVASRRVRRITSSAGVDCRPTWSLDGRMLAFESNRSGEWEIYLVNSDGTGEKPLPFNEEPSANVVYRVAGQMHLGDWSPDGKSLAITVTGDWHRALRIVDIATGQVTHLLENYDDLADVVWSPDGAAVAATFRGGALQGENDFHSGVLTVGRDGKNLRILVREGPLKTRPGGGSIESETSRPSPYSSGDSFQPWLIRSFSSLKWTRNGNRLYFSSDLGSDGYFRVYSISPGGEKPVAVEGSESAWLQEISVPN